MTLSIFGPHGRARLDALVRTTPLLTFDFDGTLCEIEAQPDASRTLPQNLKLMRRLCRRVPVGIITGRAVRDIKTKLGFTPKYVVGNHGLEGLDHAAADRAVAVVRGWRKQLAAEWAPFADDPGVFIEDKAFSLSLHFRLGRRPAQASRLLRERIARLMPAPRMIGGKFIFNLTLPNSAHKGTALTELMRREKGRPALFVGDDVTDEDAFRVKRAGIVKVRVGRSSVTAAEYHVPDLGGVTALLDWLNERV